MKIPKLKSYKVLSIIILVILGIFILFMTTEKSRALRTLEKNLYKRYGEEFNISALYKRKSNSGIRYQAEYIYPKSYDGTLKGYDSYYWGKGFVRVENLGLKLIAGDTYGGVLLNESANEFYLSKLKELFGENVLPILDVRGAYKYTDFQKEYLREEKTISGGIYIFGRVESDEDREWYRKQIYEFVQFMKETGTFEYVDLGVVIWDERVLSEEFRTNEDLRKAILVARNIMDDDKEFIKERKRLMKQTDESMKKLTKEEKDKILNSYIKSDIYGVGNRNDEIFVYNKLLGMRIYSPKYIEMKGWNKSKDPDVYEEIKNYDNVSDIKFTFEQY